MNWRHIIEALNHELYPVIGTAAGQSVDDLVERGSLNEDDLSEEAVDKVVGVLKDKKKGLINKEIDAIKQLVARAKVFGESTAKIVTPNMQNPSRENS